MMTTDRIDFALRKGQDVCDDNDDDTSLDDSDDFLSMPLPSLSMNNSVIIDESNNEFLRLTAMVRAVYFSYLHKCLLDQMELHAVRLALEATLYRENMLRMIADIKSHTVKKKAYKKLVIFLETSKDKIDVAVQTDDRWSDLQEVDNTQNIYIMPNCEEALETVHSSNSHTSENMKSIDNEMDTHILQETVKEESNDASQGNNDQNDFSMMDDLTTIRNEDENSQDSLLQHMEDMFCESDDSSDITKLIEKHSGVTKANIDKEINKICLEADLNLFDIPQNDNIPKSKIAKVSTSKGKVSFSRYKEMQNRKANKSKETNGNGIGENKQKQRLNAIWFVERVHQVSQLKAKMTELSLTNYRKHGKIKEQFLELFGECEEEEMMPESPICIEDYLPACKERIAPWIVKYLMPFYKKRRIKGRQLFKIVAKYIADMLIIENTFPEQKCVSKYIESYFKNKKFIKTKQDIYL
ncbi:uncharacterized protein [Polyergus mexicanus]|uniref:uncharacterized protein isoform X2 n=1 Tax=Polyergus mexicanus TaxID=615972 RepID=UPI0038B4F86B